MINTSKGLWTETHQFGAKNSTQKSSWSKLIKTEPRRAEPSRVELWRVKIWSGSSGHEAVSIIFFFKQTICSKPFGHWVLTDPFTACTMVNDIHEVHMLIRDIHIFLHEIKWCCKLKKTNVFFLYYRLVYKNQFLKSFEHFVNKHDSPLPPSLLSSTFQCIVCWF